MTAAAAALEQCPLRKTTFLDLRFHLLKAIPAILGSVHSVYVNTSLVSTAQRGRLVTLTPLHTAWAGVLLGEGSSSSSSSQLNMASIASQPSATGAGQRENTKLVNAVDALKVGKLVPPAPAPSIADHL